MLGDSIVAICQYGGEFLSSSDGSVAYTGGEAHAINIGREMPLHEVMIELSNIFNADMSGMALKYFLPNNRRTLITVSCDKDLQRMVEFNSCTNSAEVFVVSRVDHRANRSSVMNSGTSIVATHEDDRGTKRKRGVTKNSARLTEARCVIPFQNTPNDGNIAMRQKRIVLNDHLDCSDARILAVDFGDDIAGTGTSCLDNNMQQDLVIASDKLERDSMGMLDDSANLFGVPLVVSPENSHSFNAVALWDDIIKGVGQEFDNVMELREQLCKYALVKGFIYRFVKDETTRVTVKCVGENCTWRLHASESSRNKKIVIKKMNDVHTCGGGSGQGQRRVTRQWLTGLIKQKLNGNLQRKPKELVKELYEEYGVNLSYSQVWRGREVASKEILTSMNETYNHLPWYAQKIEESNPGSVIILSPFVDPKFRRFFVSYHACLHAFLHGCRPLIFLDRIPLRTTNEFKLLVAATVDADDAILPIAFSVVEDVNYECWVWFLLQLKYATRTCSSPITFVSNRQKGLDEAVPHVFEDCYHAYCMHHLIEEFEDELKRGPWPSKVRNGMVEDFTRAAEACSIEEFDASINNVRNISAEAADWIMASKPEHWSDAKFVGLRYDHFSSNIADTFDNWISTKQESSIVQIFDSIRKKLMELIETRRENSVAWTGILTPALEFKLQKEVQWAGKLRVLCSSDTIFEVRGNDIFVVNIGTWECSCRRWQITGLPCMHAVAVFNRIDKSVYEFCSRYFQVDCYQLTYAESINPIPEVENIDFSSGMTIYPRAPRPADRPRRKRFNPNRTTTVVRLCSRCKQAGHNKATCEAVS